MDLESTYRNEGLSVGSDHMRLFGEEIQLEVAITDLVLGNRIGQGACSSVNLAKHKKTGEVYAVKMFNIHDKKQASQLYNEILLLTSFQCDALIALKGAFHDQGCIGVIIEYMDRGSLDFLLDSDIEISEEVMAAIAFQMIWGLGYLHYEKQIHRDIKPGNALMNSLGQVKLSDFGISKELDNTIAMSNTAVGTYHYMSPERLLGDKYDASGDIWSFGISIVELWQKKYPFSDVSDTPIDLYGELEDFRFEKLCRKSDFPPLMRDFLSSTLAFHPEERANCEHLLSSPWFESCGIVDLPSAQMIVSRWLKDVDRNSQWRKNNGSNSNSVRKPHHHHHAAPKTHSSKKDQCEMSISMENSQDLSMSMSRDRMSMSNNPYTSSGRIVMNGGPNAASRYRMVYDIGSAPTEEEYDDDFEDVVAYDSKEGDYKRGERKSRDSRDWK